MVVAVVCTAALLAAGPPLPPLPPLTLAQAIAQARTMSPLRTAAQRQALGAADAARLAGRLANPLLDVRVENLRAGQTSTLPLDVFAVVGQPIELGGKRGLRVGIADADRDLAGAGLQIVEWQVALRAAQLYVQALKARGLFETLTANRDGLTTLITTMRRRVEQGYSAESDLLKFETESARLDIDIARAGLELDRSLSALTFLIGSPAPVAAAQLVEPRPIAPPSLDFRDIAGAMARHPEVVSATARVERTRRIAALERARRMPDPVVTAGYKRTSGFDTAIAGVTLAVPIFDRNGSAVARAAGDERAATAERDALAARLASEAASLIATARALSERSTRAQRDLLEPADAVRSAALAAFREGTADVLRLLDAERVFLDVRRTALELRLEALAAGVEATLAVGQEVLP